MTSGIPDQPDPIIVQIVNLNVVFTWAEPVSNFADILRYKLTIVQSDGVTFTEETTYCDASQDLIRLQKFCLVPQRVLTASPYSLTFDTLIQAKVAAFNRNGWSVESVANVESTSLKDTIQVVPGAITTLMEGLLTNTQQIELEWTELISHEETGGAEITSYNIQWDKGQYGLVWEHLVGYEADMLGNDYIVTQSILPSFEYRF